MLVHGEAGVGKSHLGDTAPAPRLILDGEGRAKYLPSQPKVLWDPKTQQPPAFPANGEWQTCVATVVDFPTMERVYQWLQSGQHPFRSVIVDSLMEVQKRLIDDLVGPEQLDQQDWGRLLRGLEKLVRDYRDLVIVPSNPVECVVMTTGTRESNGKMRPMLQGQMATQVPYFMDVVMYMYATYDPTTQQTGRSGLVQPTPQAVAKDGTNRLGGPVIPNPDLGQIFAQLNGFDASGVSLAAPVVSQTEQPAAAATQGEA